MSLTINEPDEPNDILYNFLKQVDDYDDIIAPNKKSRCQFPNCKYLGSFAVDNGKKKSKRKSCKKHFLLILNNINKH